MSNKQTEQFLEEVAETLQEKIFQCRELAKRLADFPDKTKAKRQELAEELHIIQSVLHSSEIKEDIKREDMKDPSEGTPWHPEHK